MDTRQDHIRALRRLIGGNLAPATTAMARIETRLQQEHLDRVEKKRRLARLLAAVAEVAREVELDPGMAERGSGHFFREGEPGYRNSIFRPGQEIPRWTHRAHELRVDAPVRHASDG